MLVTCITLVSIALANEREIIPSQCQYSTGCFGQSIITIITVVFLNTDFCWDQKHNNILGKKKYFFACMQTNSVSLKSKLSIIFHFFLFFYFLSSIIIMIHAAQDYSTANMLSFATFKTAMIEQPGTYLEMHGLCLSFVFKQNCMLHIIIIINQLNARALYYSYSILNTASLQQELIINFWFATAQ